MDVSPSDPLYVAVCRALGVRQTFAIENASQARKRAEVEWFKLTMKPRQGRGMVQ